MSYRPPSSSGNRPTTASRNKLGTSAGRPPGTATRLMTGMAPGTARPGTRGGVGGGGSINTTLNVGDRPMTQQGLGGLKTASRGPQRQIQDKSYFVGLLRTKMNDMMAENNKMKKEMEEINEEQSSYLTYEKRAESLANTLKELQGELGDYNTLVDKLNTDSDINDVQMDLDDLKTQNDKEAKAIDDLFTQRQQQESLIKQLEIELEQEKRMADNLVADMKPEMRDRYSKLKHDNEDLLAVMEKRQQEIDALNTKKENLEEELSQSQIKQEAVRLYDQLHELEAKRDQLMEEQQSKGTPAEEREKLLKQVKDDNQEIASMDRQTKDIHEKLEVLQEELRQLDMDIEENQGEKNQKYKELKKREDTMNEFLEGFDRNKEDDSERSRQLEANIVALLEHQSRNLSRFSHLPSPKELESMKDDLSFKSNEMKKSENTAMGLAGESEKLKSDLEKVEQLEGKIGAEMNMLHSKIAQMERDLATYSDLDTLKADAEARKKRLINDRVLLQKRRDTFKKIVHQLKSEYEALKAQLNDNETYTQLGNLERKWQHHEQNNFVMKEFISTKTMECDYHPIVKNVTKSITDYNKSLQDQLSGKSTVS